MDLEEGGSVLVEVTDAVSSRPGHSRRKRRGARDGRGRDAREALDQLGPVVKGVVTKLREAADWPDEVTVEFSIKLSADANVIIARTGGEANFKISMRWSRAEGG